MWQHLAQCNAIGAGYSTRLVDTHLPVCLPLRAVADRCVKVRPGPVGDHVRRPAWHLRTARQRRCLGHDGSGNTREKGSIFATKAVKAQDRGSVFATKGSKKHKAKALTPQHKGSVVATKAVKAQGKRGFAPASASAHSKSRVRTGCHPRSINRNAPCFRRWHRKQRHRPPVLSVFSTRRYFTWQPPAQASHLSVPSAVSHSGSIVC